MTEQEIKLELVRIFGTSQSSIDLCKKAYEFITGSKELETVSPMISTKVAFAKATAIDLGLTSGTLWADRNLDAKSPEDIGKYFSWGNTKGYTPSDNPNFSDEAYDKTTGHIAQCNLFEPYDAAQKLLGDDWKMPAKWQFHELMECCDWKWIENGKVKGYRVTGINGNSIFLPCTGYYSGRSLGNSSYGYYWSTTWSSSSSSYSLGFYSSNKYTSNYGRYYGMVVRPITHLPKH